MPDAAAVYAVDPTLGAEFERSRAEIGRAQAAAAASDAERAGRLYKNQSEMWTDFHTLISGAVDEPTYQQNLAQARARGFDVSQAPPNFDPNWVANAGRAVLTAKERYERDNPTLSFQNVGDRLLSLHPTTGAQVGPAYRVGKSPNTQTTNINLPALPKKEQESKGELNVEIYKGIRETAIRGRKAEPAIDTALAVLDKGFGTGTGTATTAKIAGALSALGIPEATAYANDAAVFQATVQQTVLDRQFEQKGPQTEADAARITQTAANLGNPTDANRFLLNVAKAQIKRDNAQQRFFDKWWNTNKTYEGAEEAWYSGEGGKSLFSDPALAKYAPKEEPAAPAKPAATAPAATPVAPPKIGTVRNGYKFKGGDPRVSTNWEKM